MKPLLPCCPWAVTSCPPLRAHRAQSLPRACPEQGALLPTAQKRKKDGTATALEAVPAQGKGLELDVFKKKQTFQDSTDLQKTLSALPALA